MAEYDHERNTTSKRTGSDSCTCAWPPGLQTGANWEGLRAIAAALLALNRCAALCRADKSDGNLSCAPSSGGLRGLAGLEAACEDAGGSQRCRRLARRRVACRDVGGCRDAGGCRIGGCLQGWVFAGTAGLQGWGVCWGTLVPGVLEPGVTFAFMGSLLPFQLGLYGLLREREAREAAMVRKGVDTGTLNSSPGTDGHAAGAAALRSRRALAAEGVGGDFCGQSLSGRPWTCSGYHRCPWLSPLSPLIPWGLQDLTQSSGWGPGSVPNRTWSSRVSLPAVPSGR